MRKILFFVPLFLWTCGGGGSSPTEPTTPQLPTVNNINVATIEDNPVAISFVGSEPSGLSLTFSMTGSPQNGSVVVSGSAATYTPNENFNGQDTFGYIATSTNGNSNVGLVTISVTPADDDPLTLNVSAVTDEDNSIQITLEAEEYDGDDIKFNIITNPNSGSVSVEEDIATYVPNQDFFGEDSFIFEAVDSNSKKILNTATASITVNPINDAPAVSDTTVFVSSSTEIELEAYDIENDNISFSILNQPTTGSATISGSNLLEFTLDSNDADLDSLTVQAYDGTDYSDEMKVYMNISRDWIIEYRPGNDDIEPIGAESDLNNNFIVLGTKGNPGTAFMLKYDKSGNLIFEQDLYFSGRSSFDIDKVSDGLIVGGLTDVDGDGSNYESYITKMDFEGNNIWEKNIIIRDRFQVSDVVESNSGYKIFGISRSRSDGSWVDYRIEIIDIDYNGNTVSQTTLDFSPAEALFGYEAKKLSDNNYGFLLSADQRNGQQTNRTQPHFLKFDEQNNIINSYVADTQDDSSWNAFIDFVELSSGQFWTVGSSNAYALFADINNDLSSGNFYIGPTVAENYGDVAIIGNGNVVSVCNDCQGSYDYRIDDPQVFSSVPLQAKDLNEFFNEGGSFENVFSTNDGGAVLVGKFYKDPGGQGIFLMKLDAFGVLDRFN